MSFIYKITNKLNGKIYIGETNRTIEIRWRQHQQRSKDLSMTEYLYRAMRKYGLENFTIEEIEQCDPIDRFQRETYYIIQYNSLAPNGYNLVLNQNSPTVPMIDEILNLWNQGFTIVSISNKLHLSPKTVSECLKSNGITQNDIFERRSLNAKAYSSKSVIQYTLCGEYVQEWESASEAARNLNLNVASICKVCKQDLLTYNNYIWQYKESDDIENIVVKVASAKKVGKNRKKVQSFNQQGQLVQEFPSASAAGRAFGVAHAGIAYAARHGTMAYGYYWKYIEE